MDTTTTEPTPSQPTTPKPPKPQKPPYLGRTYSPGFLVVGVTHARYFAHLAQREEAHAAKVAEAGIWGGTPPAQVPPLSFRQWAARVRPHPLRTEPYPVRSAADVCAELANRCGFQQVAVIEVTPQVWENRYGA